MNIIYINPLVWSPKLPARGVFALQAVGMAFYILSAISRYMYIVAAKYQYQPCDQ
jgi:hypothetical protein